MKPLKRLRTNWYQICLDAAKPSLPRWRAKNELRTSITKNCCEIPTQGCLKNNDFLNVIVKECEKEIQSYLRRVLVQKQSYGNFAGMRVKTLFKQLFFTCFIYVVVF